MAERSNASALLKDADLSIAGRNYAHRFNILMPQLTGQATLVRPNVEPVSPIPGFTPPRWSLEGQLSAQLALSYQMVYGVRALGDALGDARIDAAEARRRLALEVTKAFNQALLSQEQLAQTKRRLASAEERVNELRGLYAAGLVDELTLLRSQVALETQRPLLFRQESALEGAARNLALSLGLRDGALVYPQGPALSPGVGSYRIDDLLAQLGRNAELAALERAERGLAIQSGLSRAEMYPALVFAYSYRPRLSGDPFSEELWEKDRWKDQGAFSITLRQPVDPLLPGSKTWQALANQDEQRRKLALQREQLRAGLELQLRQLLGAIDAGGKALSGLRSSVALAERALYLAEEAFSRGVRDYAVVRDAELDLADARLQLLQEEYRLLDLQLDLAYLLNLPFEALLEYRR